MSSLHGLHHRDDVAPTPKRTRRLHLYEICPHRPVIVEGKPSKRIRNQSGSSKEGLTVVKRGDLPVILSAPHGATTKDPLFKWQMNNLAVRGEKPEEFDPESFESRLNRVNSDTNTFTLAMEIAAQLKKQNKGNGPYVVAARFHRKFVDVNRRLNETGYCCPSMWPKCTAIQDGQGEKISAARSVYLGYHRAIVDILEEIAFRFPGKPILLLDVHAQKATDDDALGISAETFRDVIIVGTQDGRCVRDRGKLYAKGGFLGSLNQGLFEIGAGLYPANDAQKDHPKYNGGHLVAEYGYNNTMGVDIDAMQFEFGANLRLNSKIRAKIAQIIAKTILKSEYLS